MMRTKSCQVHHASSTNLSNLSPFGFPTGVAVVPPISWPTAPEHPRMHTESTLAAFMATRAARVLFTFRCELAMATKPNAPEQPGRSNQLGLRSVGLGPSIHGAWAFDPWGLGLRFRGASGIDPGHPFPGDAFFWSESPMCLHHTCFASLGLAPSPFFLLLQVET